MAKNELLEKFYADLSQEIMNKLAADETEDFQENVFTQIYIDHLTEAAEVEDGNISYHEARGLKINAYSVPEDEETLVLFVSIFKNSPEVYSVPPSEVTLMLKRLKQFYVKSCEGYHKDLEEAYSAFDIAHTIYQMKDKISVVRLMLLTNGTIREVDLPTEEINGVSFVSSVWDIERIYRVCTSGEAREKIVVDLPGLTGRCLDAISIRVPKVDKFDKEGGNHPSGGYTSYLTAIPGDMLYKIYEQFNARLLEKNVRAFLQAKGGVNKGIKATITDMPEMFLAYNNGLSATAEKIEMETSQDGRSCRICKIFDFQIVNGGQTTASIFNTCVKNKEPLSRIFVQAKITVLDDATRMDEVVPLISKCANTQNKVQMADFSANDAFHQEIEKLSRTVWAPALTGGQRQTKWFYERSRGQYADTRSREKTTAYFDSVYPKKQYFDKIELARVENLWDLLPNIAAKGGQASFREFMIRVKKRGQFVPDMEYFQNLVAKTILYRRIRKIVKLQDFYGYWVNISDYTFAFLCHKTAQRLDLHKIWKNQDLSIDLQLEIERMAHLVNSYLIDSSQGRNITQWCKQQKCWEGLRDKPWSLNREVEESLIAYGKRKKQNIEAVSESEAPLIEAVQKIPSNLWFEISSWSKETNALQSWQNGIAFTLGRYASTGKAPSIKQAKQAVKIMSVAIQNGFTQDEDAKALVEKFAEKD